MSIDKSVILKAKEGEIKAFREIFDFYIPKMRPVCNRYCINDFETEDILQESFIKIYKNLKNFKFDGSFDGWVRKTVINTTLNYLKKEKAKLQTVDFDDIKESEIPEESIEEILNLEEIQLVEIINCLPQGYKMVFTLYVLDDFSHKEIGETLGISEGSSRSQYSKAKKMIYKLLLGLKDEKKSSLINKIAQNEK